MNTEDHSQYPGIQSQTGASKPEHTPQNPNNADKSALRPIFRTSVGYALWDIHQGRYPDRLVPHADAAEIARLKVSTLTTMRSRKNGPPYVRIFGTPYYDLADLIHWIEEKMEFSRV